MFIFNFLDLAKIQFSLQVVISARFWKNVKKHAWPKFAPFSVTLYAGTYITSLISSKYGFIQCLLGSKLLRGLKQHVDDRRFLQMRGLSEGKVLFINLYYICTVKLIFC